MVTALDAERLPAPGAVKQCQGGRDSSLALEELVGESNSISIYVWPALHLALKNCYVGPYYINASEKFLAYTESEKYEATSLNFKAICEVSISSEKLMSSFSGSSKTSTELPCISDSK